MLVGISLAQHLVNCFGFTLQVDRRKDAPVLRQQVRNEGHNHIPSGEPGQLLVEFGRMAMHRDIVGLKPFRNLCVQ